MTLPIASAVNPIEFGSMAAGEFDKTFKRAESARNVD